MLYIRNLNTPNAEIAVPVPDGIWSIDVISGTYAVLFDISVIQGIIYNLINKHVSDEMDKLSFAEFSIASMTTRDEVYNGNVWVYYMDNYLNMATGHKNDNMRPLVDPINSDEYDLYHNIFHLINNRASTRLKFNMTALKYNKERYNNAEVTVPYVMISAPALFEIITNAVQAPLYKDRKDFQKYYSQLLSIITSFTGN